MNKFMEIPKFEVGDNVRLNKNLFSVKSNEKALGYQFLKIYHDLNHFLVEYLLTNKFKVVDIEFYKDYPGKFYFNNERVIGEICDKFNKIFNQSLCLQASAKFVIKQIVVRDLKHHYIYFIPDFLLSVADLDIYDILQNEINEFIK